MRLAVQSSRITYAVGLHIMTQVFNDSIKNGSVYNPDQLRLMKMVFEELCADHKLTHDKQDQRDALAMAIVEAGRLSTDETVLKTAGLKSIIRR
jgi:hypothetical protein